MSVLIISQHYRPEPNFIPPDVAEHLAKRVAVTVVTSHPHYPLGRFYPGTRWWWPRISIENGVRVCRVPMFPDRSRSVVRRLASYLSFVLTAGVAAVLVGGRPRVVWVYQGPFTTALAGLVHKYVLGARLVITCADLWPESFTASGVMGDGVVTRLALGFRRWLNRRADLIIGSTRGTLERFRDEGIAEVRLVYAPVWITAQMPEGAGDETREDAIVYAGNLGPAQALDSVVRGAALLLADGIKVEIHLYGTGSDLDRLRTLSAQVGASNVHFKGSVSPNEAFQRCSRSLAQIVSLRPSPMFRFTVPSKLTFSLAAASPVLYALEGESRRILEATDGGFSYAADDDRSFAEAVKRVLALGADDRRRIRLALRRRFEDEFAPSLLLQRYSDCLLGAAR